MTAEELRATLAGPSPPEGLPPTLVALWHLARGNWDLAHRTIQSHGGEDAARVHAHLHRVEGDMPNARYWYGLAGHAVPRCDPGEEWNDLVSDLGRVSGASR